MNAYLFIILSDGCVICVLRYSQRNNSIRTLKQEQNIGQETNINRYLLNPYFLWTQSKRYPEPVSKDWLFNVWLIEVTFKRWQPLIGEICFYWGHTSSEASVMAWSLWRSGATRGIPSPCKKKQTLILNFLFHLAGQITPVYRCNKKGNRKYCYQRDASSISYLDQHPRWNIVIPSVFWYECGDCTSVTLQSEPCTGLVWFRSPASTCR